MAHIPAAKTVLIEARATTVVIKLIVYATVRFSIIWHVGLEFVTRAVRLFSI